MTTYALLQGVTAIQTAPNAVSGIPNGSQAINPSAGQAPLNPQTQTFHVVVTTTSGNGSATVQPMVSNDGKNWVAYGSAIAVTSGPSPAQAISNGAQPWQFFTAYVTAISGTGAQVSCTMGV